MLLSDTEKIFDALKEFGVVGVHRTSDGFAKLTFSDGYTWEKADSDLRYMAGLYKSEPLSAVMARIHVVEKEQWCFSSNEEQYRGDEHTREHATGLALEDAGSYCSEQDDGTWTYTFWTGRAVKTDVRQFIFAHRVEEMIADNAHEFGAEYSSSEWPQLNDEQEASLKEHIAKWFEKNRPPDFFTVEDVKEHTAVSVGDADDDEWRILDA
jgi:hypothetical protein